MGINSNGTTLIDGGNFQNIGAITWDTTAKTSGFTGVSGNGYFVNTTSGAITVTLPSSPSAGDVVAIADYANTADTNNITIGRNGSNIQGTANDFIINTEGAAILLIYVDGTKGWLLIDAAQANDITAPTFITATGGTITTSGNFKIHTFTGPGTFTVCSVGCAGVNDKVDYLVVAGGGAGGAGGASGGGGAGGYRESSGAASGCYSVSPRGSGVPAITVSAQGYPISIGAGGATRTQSNIGNSGSNSTALGKTSTGGGGGAYASSSGPSGFSGNATNGGSGGGAACWRSSAGTTANGTAGSGNTPPVSPAQGSNGGAAPGSNTPDEGMGGGGGGATAAGSSPPGQTVGGAGGAGGTSSINGTPTARGGGGGGVGRNHPGTGTGGAGGTGGGGAGASQADGTGNAVSGTTNTGGGGGGSSQGAGSGGSGIVIIRYRFQ